MTKIKLAALITLCLICAPNVDAQDAGTNYSWKDESGRNNRIGYEGEGFGRNRLFVHEITIEPEHAGETATTATISAAYSCTSSKIASFREPTRPEFFREKDSLEVTESEWVVRGAHVAPLAKWEPYSGLATTEQKTALKKVLDRACSLPTVAPSTREIIMRAGGEQNIYAMMIRGALTTGQFKTAWLKEYNVRRVAVNPEQPDAQFSVLVSDLRPKSLVKHTLDCINFKDRVDAVIRYADDGAVVDNWTGPSSYTAIAPGTVGETVAEFICSLG